MSKIRWASLPLLLLLSITIALQAEDKNDPDNVDTLATPLELKLDITKTKLLSRILKDTLETYHYRHIKINDDISEKGFEEFFKKIDYGKQFLLKSDVTGLSKHRTKLDDEMQTGDLALLKESVKIINQRVLQADNYRKEFFKNDFDFSQKEILEIDPKKRDFAKSETELKEHWRKLFKQATLSRIFSMIEEEREAEETLKKNTPAKDKKKSSTPPEKPLSMPEKIAKARESISNKYRKVFQRILTERDDDKLELFFNSVTSVIDPHTTYMPPQRKEDFDIDISGSLEGIGAVLQEDGAYIKVVSIVPGGAAWREKELEVNDIILTVSQGTEEPVDLEDMRVDDAVRYIRGKKGTEVRLNIKKADGTRKMISIIRDVVQIAASFAKSSVLQIKGQNIKVGHINVPKFYRDFGHADSRNCTDDVRKELEKLKKQKVSGVILDLRNNGGGALEDAKQMAGLFIKEGPIVQVRNYANSIETLTDTDPAVVYDGPLIVLVNRFSASASEIVAAALQDYGRAIVLGGEFTHGKGTVQALLNLDQGPLMSMLNSSLGSLKVTIQKFYRITGVSTQYKGVTPDIIIPDPFGYGENREQDLDYSLPWDEVAGLHYTPWIKQKYNLGELNKKS
ncbi:MAG: hypothetical protein A2451_16365, partial [Bdellovibrionales bacterium RIFOXYC2_FULL_39_8]